MPRVSDDMRFKVIAYIHYFDLESDSSGLIANKFYSWCGIHLSASGIRTMRKRLTVCDVVELEDGSAIITVKDTENMLKFKSYHITHDEASQIV